LKFKVLDLMQYARPGQTCNNAIWQKELFLDLSHQHLSPGIMTDYDATVDFDCVLAGLAISWIFNASTFKRHAIPSDHGVLDIGLFILQ
jgi:hypothetical protein